MKKNMFWLAVEGMKGERRSSVLRIIILFLSFTFLTASLTVTASLNKTAEEYRYSQYGSWKSAVLEATDADSETFAKNESIEKFGTAQICGTVIDANGVSLTAVGSLDEDLQKIGRISLQAGRMPKTEQEIAVEADVLSALGYDYLLGQSIVLPIRRGNQIIEKEFSLCGVLKEYTDIWSHGDALLAGAVVCQKGAEKIGQPICYQYFLVSEKTNAQLIREFGKGYSLIANRALQSANSQQEAYWGFVAIILITTIVSVSSLYFCQMTGKVRSVALLRSIGGTKRQLKHKLFYETCCAAVPAIFGGSIAGAGITWCALSAILTIDQKNIYVTIPFGSLALVTLLWLLSIFFSQLLVLRLAFRQPLVGKVTQGVKEVRRSNRRKSIGMTALAGMFLAVGILVYVQSLSYLYTSDIWEGMYDYSVKGQGENYVTEETLQEIEQIAGIEDIFAVRQLQAAITFSGMEDSRLIMKIEENDYKTQPSLTDTELFPQGMGVYVYGIREADIEEFLAEIDSSIDRDAFIEGEQIILWFGNEEYSMCETQEDIGLTVGDNVTVNMYATAKKQESGYHILEKPIMVGARTVRVGEIMIRDAQEVVGYTSFGNHYYTVIAAEKFVCNLLREGSDTGMLLSNGDTMKTGYSYAQIKTGMDAAYLSTDYAVSAIAKNAGNEFVNERELHAAYRQEARQGLIFLRLSGGCIGLILLLLIWNILVGAAEENRKKYGILQAIGMSRRQMMIKVVKSGFCFCGGAMVQAAGWFVLYCVGISTDCFRLGFDVIEFASICVVMLLILLLFYIITQSIVLRGTPMQLLKEERR